MEALVEYNYEAQESDELSIKKGDVIKDVKVLNGGWWEGTLRDKRGMFPDNFVKMLEPPGAAAAKKEPKQEEVTLRNGSGRKYCRVLYSYEPCNDDELKLTPHENIEYLGEVEEGWWKGRVKGRTGVFPSNFVSTPVPEEWDVKKEKKEFCRVLYPYDAANEDELTLAEGDIITVLSKDAPDKGWWKGEINGRIGLFPDNFVEVITVKNEPGQMNDLTMTKSSTTKHPTGKKKETANVRKSLDVRNIKTESSTSSMKKITSSSSASSLSSSVGKEEKKASNLINSLKRLVGDSSTTTSNNGNATTEVDHGIALGEELDEVERIEGAPLSHLTASRAKAPRRRLPSTQHLRHHNLTSGSVSSAEIVEPEDNMTNGSADVFEPPIKEDESDGLVAKARKKAPWVEELKLNQAERRKIGSERIEKGEVKKDRAFSWLPPSTNNSDVPVKSDSDRLPSSINSTYGSVKPDPDRLPPSINNIYSSVKPDMEADDYKFKEKEKPNRVEESPSSDCPAFSPLSSPPAYVPYHLYSQLLDRVAVLEEKQTVLQRKVNQLTEQLAPYIADMASEKD